MDEVKAPTRLERAVAELDAALEGRAYVLVYVEGDNAQTNYGGPPKLCRDLLASSLPRMERIAAGDTSEVVP